MVDINNVHKAIEDGATTSSEILDYVDATDRSHVSRELKNLTAEGYLTRTKNGRAYEYGIPAQHSVRGESGTAADGGTVVQTSNGEQPPGSRVTGDAPASPTARGNLTTEDLQFETDYDWDDFVPSGTPEYVPTNSEYEEIRALIDGVGVFGRPAHIRLTGPTGAGKTHLPRYLADEDDAPLFTVAVKHALDSTDLIGRFVFAGGETRWINGQLTKAILASQDRTVYLLLDEVNLARPEAKSALFEALDDRAKVTIDALGGKTISGNPENIVVFSTMNVGRDHVTEELDLAEKRRLGGVWKLNHLGLNYPEREIDLLCDRTGCHELLAEAAVNFANDVRETAQQRGTDITRGVPTGVLIEFVQSARKFAKAELINSAVRAGKAQIVRPLYDNDGPNEPGKETVISTLNSYFDGCPPEAVLDRNEMAQFVETEIKDDPDLSSEAATTS